MARRIMTRSKMCDEQCWLASVAFVIAGSRWPSDCERMVVPSMLIVEEGAEVRRRTLSYAVHYVDHCEGMRLHPELRESQQLGLDRARSLGGSCTREMSIVAHHSSPVLAAGQTMKLCRGNRAEDRSIHMSMNLADRSGIGPSSLHQRSCLEIVCRYRLVMRVLRRVVEGRVTGIASLMCLYHLD